MLSHTCLWNDGPLLVHQNSFKGAERHQPTGDAAPRVKTRRTCSLHYEDGSYTTESQMGARIHVSRFIAKGIGVHEGPDTDQDALFLAFMADAMCVRSGYGVTPPESGSIC